MQVNTKEYVQCFLCRLRRTRFQPPFVAILTYIASRFPFCHAILSSTCLQEYPCFPLFRVRSSSYAYLSPFSRVGVAVGFRDSPTNRDVFPVPFLLYSLLLGRKKFTSTS